MSDTVGPGDPIGWYNYLRTYWRNHFDPRLGPRYITNPDPFVPWQADLRVDIIEYFNPFKIWRKYIQRLRERLYRPGGRAYARTMRSFMGTAHEYNKRRRIS